MKSRALVALPALIVVATLGGAVGASATARTFVNSATHNLLVPNTRNSAVTACHTSQVRFRLVSSGGAAGTAYYAIVFTRRAGAACSLRGYPRVAFLAHPGGSTVGAPASHNPRNAVATITIASGGSASALLGIARYQNYTPSACKSHSVSGLRVTLPGSTTSGYLGLPVGSAACSTQVHQLSVTSIVAGQTGM